MTITPRHDDARLFERALLPTPQLVHPGLRFETALISSRAGIVSGDFFDCIQLDDGRVRAVIGDVSGHGTDEAALGVSLRAGWRALVVAGLDDDDVLGGLERLLECERPRGDEYATVCDLTISADLGHVIVRSAGHPPPVLVDTGPLLDRHRRTPLGVARRTDRPAGTAFPLGSTWSLVLYTDGLFEIRDYAGEILPMEAVGPAVDRVAVDGTVHPRRLLAEFASRGPAGWRDDVAVGVLSTTPTA